MLTHWLRIYGVLHTIVWIPLIVLVFVFGHYTTQTLAIILAGAFGPAVVMSVDCAVIAYYSRRTSRFFHDEDTPSWVTWVADFAYALFTIWLVYRHGETWKRLREMETILEGEQERVAFGENLAARAVAVMPENVRQVQLLVARGNFLAAQTLVERAEAKRKHKVERSQKQNDGLVASRAHSLLAKGRSLGIENEVAALFNQGDGGKFEAFEAAETLIAETVSKYELRKMLDLLEERIAEVPRRYQQDLCRQVENLAQCVYPSRDFRKVLYALEKELVVAEATRM